MSVWIKLVQCFKGAADSEGKGWFTNQLVIPFHGACLLLILILTPFLHTVNPNLDCSLTILHDPLRVSFYIVGGKKQLGRSAAYTFFVVVFIIFISTLQIMLLWQWMNATCNISLWLGAKQRWNFTVFHVFTTVPLQDRGNLSSLFKY